MICIIRRCPEKANPKIQLCEIHFQVFGLKYLDLRTPYGAGWMEVEKLAEQKRREQRLAQEIERGRYAMEHRARLAERSVVYYVQTGRYIKIGFTSDLKRRLSELRLHETAVLAAEPGGRKLEAQRHAEFADERIDPRREDFALSLRIQEHIRELNEEAA